MDLSKIHWYPVSRGVITAAACCLSLIVAYVTVRYGIAMGVIFALIPTILYCLIFAITNPYWAFMGVFVLNYLVIGLSRYVRALQPGIAMDGMLGFIILLLILRHTLYKKVEFNRALNWLLALNFLWFVYCMFELSNPHSVSEAWVKTVRSLAIYPILISGLTAIIFYRFKDIRRVIFALSILTLAAVLKAFIQKHYGFDSFENYWLFVEGGQTTHIIGYGIRYFSFFSDASNFGAAMGFSMVVLTVAALQYKDRPRLKWYYLFVAVAAFWGFLTTGTRSALAVPLAGFAMYIFLSKRFMQMFLGAIMLGGFFVFLNFTTIGQGVTEIRRMRSAFDSNDASYVVRLENQAKLRELLKDKPFGTGLGLGGGKAKEYLPDAPISQVATDSWFVMIWVETGIVGLILHILILLTIIGYGSYLVLFKLKNPRLRGIVAGLTSGVTGMVVASYANELYGQFPNGIIMYMSETFIFLSPHYDTDTDLINEIEDNSRA